MVLYVPGGSENVITDTYLRRFWSESCGYRACCGQLRLGVSPGWHDDQSWPECNPINHYCCGGHGGCGDCIMTQSQVIADYQTEVTFISTPPGARIYINGVEWWPGAVTAADGATFRGVPPTLAPTVHTYEMRLTGYRSATGTLELIEGVPAIITGDLSPLGIISTNIVPYKTICAAPCDVSIDVTWTNDAPTGMDFIPSITIDDEPISPAQYTTETLATGASITRTFLSSGLTAGSYMICADPNGGTACVLIAVLTPEDIVATVITPSVTTCIAPCDITVDITWTNNGQTAGTFTPTMTVNGTPTALTPETLDPGQSITRTFPLTGLTAGTYSICADPNVLPCATVTVQEVAAAGFGGTGMLLMAGLAIGALILATKKEQSEANVAKKGQHDAKSEIIRSTK